MAHALWPLLERPGFPDSHIDWAAHTVANVEPASDRFVRFVENRIRSGRPMSQQMYRSLANAYEMRRDFENAARAL